MIVVSDASPLNILVRIGFIDVLLYLSEAFRRLRETDFIIAQAILSEALFRDTARKRSD